MKSRPVGRPKKDQNDKINMFIKVGLTTEEHCLVLNLAQELGISVSECVRRIIRNNGNFRHI